MALAWWKLVLAGLTFLGVELTYLGANPTKIAHGGWLRLLIAALALRANVEFNRVLHQRVVIVSAVSESVPHVPPTERLSVDDLGYTDDGIVHLTVRFGFQDDQDIPAVLRAATRLGRDDPELDLDPGSASYFLSRISLERGRQPGMRTWRKRLFIALSRNAASLAAYFHLPVDRTVVMGSRIEV